MPKDLAESGKSAPLEPRIRTSILFWKHVIDASGALDMTGLLEHTLRDLKTIKCDVVKI